jgi:hypothetical protein
MIDFAAPKSMDPAILKPIDLALPKPIYYTTGNWCCGAPITLANRISIFQMITK